MVESRKNFVNIRTARPTLFNYCPVQNEWIVGFRTENGSKFTD